MIACLDVMALAAMADQAEKVKGFLQDAKAEEVTKAAAQGAPNSVSNGVPNGVSNGIAEKA